MFYENGVPKNFKKKNVEKQLCRSLFLIKLNLIK